MDADANDVSVSDAGRIDREESLIHDRRVSITLRGCGGDNVEPTSSYDGCSERYIAEVYKVNLHVRINLHPLI